MKKFILVVISIVFIAAACNSGPNSLPETVSQTDLADWKVCDNKVAGYEVKYPEDWMVETRYEGEYGPIDCSLESGEDKDRLYNLRFYKSQQDVFSNMIEVSVMTRSNQSAEFWKNKNSLDEYVSLIDYKKLGQSQIDGETFVWFDVPKQVDYMKASTRLIAYRNNSIYQIEVYSDVPEEIAEQFTHSFNFK